MRTAQVVQAGNAFAVCAPSPRVSASRRSSSVSTSQRSDGHGVWRHKGGHTYSQRFVALIRFDTAPGPGGPGFFEGWQVVSHTLTLSDPDTLSSSGTNEFYDENGQLYRSGCSTAVGKRFQ